MSIPNCQHIVERLAAEYPDEWRKAHNPSGGGPETEAFIRRVAWVLHSTVDARFGLNGKRGNYNDVSDDVVNWIGEGPGHDPNTGQPVTVIDVIGGAGGPDPRAQWGAIDQAGPGGWIKPAQVGSAPPAQPPGTTLWTGAHALALAAVLEQRRPPASGGDRGFVLFVAEQFAYSFPGEGWGMKSAGSGRPLSDNVLARQTGGRLLGYQIVPATTQPAELVLTGQIFAPVAAVNHVSVPVVEPPPAPEPPTPEPAPVPEPPAPPASVDLAPVLAALEAQAALIVSLHDEVTALRATLAKGFDINARSRYLGDISGTVKPKE